MADNGIRRRIAVALTSQHVLSVGDQSLSSLTNFIAIIVMAQQMSAATFGLAGTLMTAATFIIGIGRGLIGEPALTRVTGTPGDRDPLGAALLAGCVACALTVTSVSVVDMPARAAVLILGVAAPVLLMQDALRFVLIARRQAGIALFGDTVWLTALIAGFAVASRAQTLTVNAAVGVFCGSCLVALGAMLVATRPKLSLRHSMNWFRSTKDLGGLYALDFLSRSGAQSLTLFLVAIICGFAAAGGLRAGQSLFGPVRVLFWSAALAAVPALRRRVIAERDIQRVVRRISLALSGLAVFVGLALWSAPSKVGHWLLGVTWPATHSLIVPLTIGVAATAWNGGTTVAFRAHEAARASTTIRIIQGILSVGGGAAGAALFGVEGSAWGLAIAGLLTSVLWEVRLSQLVGKPA